MVLKRFKARSFRNIKECDITFSEGINLLYGENAQGKTNAVEGIYMFARGKSFRAKEEKELSYFGEAGFSILIEYLDGDGENTLEYARYERERRRKRNGYAVKSQKEMLGGFRAVLFYPDDLSLVKDSPEERRAFLNIAISQIYPVYLDYYSKYKTCLENRSCIIKNAAKGGYFDEGELISWSNSMAEYAAEIYLMRKDYLKKLEKFAAESMAEISLGEENLTLEYRSDIEKKYEIPENITKEWVINSYREILTSAYEKEICAGVTLYGPHRDDVDIMINGRSARLYGSQGQQRSSVLSLKLAEGEVCRLVTGEYPVYLFDDVLSELDEKRRTYILSKIKDKQIIITTCEPDFEKIKADRVIRVKDGIYEVK